MIKGTPNVVALARSEFFSEHGIANAMLAQMKYEQEFDPVVRDHLLETHPRLRLLTAEDWFHQIRRHWEEKEQDRLRSNKDYGHQDNFLWLGSGTLITFSGGGAIGQLEVVLYEGKILFRVERMEKEPLPNDEGDWKAVETVLEMDWIPWCSVQSEGIYNEGPENRLLAWHFWKKIVKSTKGLIRVDIWAEKYPWAGDLEKLG